jgi:hypothetical protein
VKSEQIIFFIFISFTFLSGCDLFRTREPELPNKGTSGFKPPVTPEVVLENFKSAIHDHNVDNYMKCFVDTTSSVDRFTFQPSAGYETRLTNWSLDDERRYFQNLGTPTFIQPSLTLSSPQEANRTATSIEYAMEYLFFYPHQKPNIAEQVKGYMHIYLQVDKQQRWAIQRWEDRKVTTDSTWSYLKYHFY